MALTLQSSAFKSGSVIPKTYTCDGKDISPALSWTGAPTGTASFALICFDPDSPVGDWAHWVIYNIPSVSTGLTENVLKTETLSDGALQGVNSFRHIGYNGPCPPAGKPHRYFFEIYAMDSKLTLAGNTTRKQLEEAMRGHILEKTELTGTYGR